jgi:hypothetical protein
MNGAGWNHPLRGTRVGRKKPGALTGLYAFGPYRAFFFGSAFFCAELFFLVGLFFLGSAVFFGIQLNLRLVNYLLMALRISSGSMLCFQKRQLYSQNKSKQRYAYMGQYDF